MSNAVIHQSILFAQAVLWGACFVAAYDILRILRRGISHGPRLQAAEDIIYWLILACAVYALLYRFDDGALRSYTLAGMAAGMILYAATVSKAAVKFLGKGFSKIVNSFMKLLKKIKKTFTIKRSRHKKEGLVDNDGKADKKDNKKYRKRRRPFKKKNNGGQRP